MNNDLISRENLKKAMWDEAHSITTFNECGTQDLGFGLTFNEIEYVIDNAPTIETSYDLYREETCDRKAHCYDYKYWHCIGCHGCKADMRKEKEE